MKNKSSLSGYFYLIAAATSYATFGILSRLIADTFPAFAQNYFREAVSLTIVGVLLITKIISWHKIHKKDIKWIIGFSLSNSLVMILLFLAFNSIAIGTVYFLFYSTMTIVGILIGGILFKERMDLSKYIALLLVLVGLIFMFSTSLQMDDLKYIVYSLFVGVMLGFHNNFAKKISNIYHPLQIFSYASMASFFVSIIIAILLKESVPDIKVNMSSVWMFVYGIVVLLADIFMIYGYRRIEAQIASMVMPTEAFIAALFGWIFYQDRLDTNEMIGGILIILAVIVPKILSKYPQNTGTSRLIKPTLK